MKVVLTVVVKFFFTYFQIDFGSSGSGKSGSAGPIVVIAALVLVAVVVGYLFLQNQS